jgi:nucleoside-diphosphate-sugar epimerase
MRIFVTGATGYIGRVVTERALAEGHTVYGLSRHEQGDALLKSLGAIPVRGELTTFDVLSRESAAADMVLHLAYIHDFTMDHNKVLCVDSAAVDALAKPLFKTNKPLVITSGTLVIESHPAGNETNEDSPLSQTSVFKHRIRSEQHAISFAKEGVRVSAIRLPPYVYGRGGSFFIPMLLDLAAKAGESVYVDEGRVRTSGVYVDDAADLYLLSAQKAEAGEVFNGTSTTTVTVRELAEAIGTALQLPTRSVSHAEAKQIWGPFMTAVVQYENRPSNRKAIQQLGWQPHGIDMLNDISSASYTEMAKTLRQKYKKSVNQ